MKEFRVILMKISEGKTKEDKVYYRANLYCEIKTQSFVQDVFCTKEIAEKYKNYIGKDITDIVDLRYNQNNDCIQFSLT